MQATAIQQSPAISTHPAQTNGSQGKRVSWEEFQQKYANREDGFKYEWVDGMVEKTKRTMDRTQSYLLWNLLDFFDELKLAGKVTGRLLSEVELFFLANSRRPDIAWFVEEQIYNLADPAARDVPAFVIEVISTNDQINAVKKKMVNYRDAGVKVVWHIFPQLKQVDVYSGERLNKITSLEGEEICSAAPALPAFALSVNDIFKKPLKPA
ncbi:MAG: Uma2 family endonuclease [Bacteroidota bacterium]